jgi:hypothetical protein
MHSRLLSFLSNFERALLADDPAPDDGVWETARTVNYRSGLARLILAVKVTGRPLQPRGSVLLQGFKLADGAACLKLQFSWAGTETTAAHAIFAKPGCDWKSEARRLAAEWMAGPPAGAVTAPPVEEEHAVAATG